MGKPKLVYWDIRALAEPIRLLMAYTGTEYEDERLSFDPMPNFRETWMNEKYEKGLDFPNLPYYIDDNIKLSQSQAIMHYLGKKNDLYANSDEEVATMLSLELQLNDFRIFHFMMAMRMAGDNFESEREGIAKNLTRKVQELSDFLGDKKWMMGDRITIVDFEVAETLDWFRLFSSDITDSFTNIKDYLKRFNDLPAIKNYKSSDSYKDWPLFGPIMPFGWERSK